MTIRTVSQLPAVESASEINPADLIEISKTATDGYQSKKLSVDTLNEYFTGNISVDIGTNFNLYKNGNPIDVLSYTTDVDNIKSNVITLKGVKTFSAIPQIPASVSYSEDNSQITNVGKVKTMIENRSLFIGSDYMVDADPGSDNTPPTTIQRDEFMYWHFDDGTNDSTQWKNPEYNNAKTDSNGSMCQHTGYLNVYGWLADNGNVKPADAWVGLFGYMQVKDTDNGGEMKNEWVMLQMQPWILGQKCSELQYVSFNMPVKQGLRLKIKTGFAVNGNSSAASGGLQFALNQPNSFVGYIIRAED